MVCRWKEETSKFCFPCSFNLKTLARDELQKKEKIRKEKKKTLIFSRWTYYRNSVILSRYKYLMTLWLILTWFYLLSLPSAPHFEWLPVLPSWSIPLPVQWDSSAALRLFQASSPAQPSHTEWVILQTPHGPFRLLCSTEEKIHESRFRSTSIFTLWNQIENILLGVRSQNAFVDMDCKHCRLK